jgi:hypothetical protein
MLEPDVSKCIRESIADNRVGETVGHGVLWWASRRLDCDLYPAILLTADGSSEPSGLVLGATGFVLPQPREVMGVVTLWVCELVIAAPPQGISWGESV